MVFSTVQKSRHYRKEDVEEAWGGRIVQEARASWHAFRYPYH